MARTIALPAVLDEPVTVARMPRMLRVAPRPRKQEVVGSEMEKTKVQFCWVYAFQLEV